MVGDPDKKGKDITYEIGIFNDVEEILIFLVAALNFKGELVQIQLIVNLILTRLNVMLLLS